ncbi:MAG TPA: DMT family transporter [Flavobacteriales bacterium]|jgi:drug/metabolite transporter (DMT)-like permease|nr:DMT family transporter [Flavobacteriales bacterium]
MQFWQKLPDKTKGYILTFIGVLAMSNVYIFSKAALQELKLPQFGFYWFLTGLILSLILAFQQKSFKKVKEFTKRDFALLVLFGLIEIASTTFFFKAINTIPNPGVVAFMGNITPVFVLILGFIILKERFNKMEILGIIITLAAAFLLSYNPKWIHWNEMFVHGSLYVLLFALFGATSAILMKLNVVRFSPILLTINRTTYLLLFSLLMMKLRHLPFEISTTALKNVLIGAFLGPFLTATVGLYAIKYIEVSRKAILSSTKGLFVLLGSYLYFKKVPSHLQIIGGILSIIGVFLIITGKKLLNQDESN